MDSGTYSPVFVRSASILPLQSVLTHALTQGRYAFSHDVGAAQTRFLRSGAGLTPTRAGHAVSVGDKVEVTKLNKERTVFGWPGMA